MKTKKKTIKLSESRLKGMIRQIIRESMSNGACTKESWYKFLNGREPLFEFADGIVYIDYNDETGCLESGGCTNTGFHPDGEVSVPVEGCDFSSALEEVYSELCSMHEELA